VSDFQQVRGEPCAELMVRVRCVAEQEDVSVRAPHHDVVIHEPESQFPGDVLEHVVETNVALAFVEKNVAREIVALATVSQTTNRD
jgi:hypothetical protein